MNDARFSAIVLAGERPEGNALAQALGLPAGVLAPLGGRSTMARVLDALRASRSVTGGVVCGPAAPVLERTPELRDQLAQGDFRWLAPAAGPAASAAVAAAALGTRPLLLTTADHGLLDGALVDAFCTSALEARAARPGLDLVVGLVPYELVRSAFPASRRTRLRFADGEYCGSNLFAVLGDAGIHALGFWSEVEAHRKSPWKIARHLGFLTLLRYLARTLTVDAAFAAVSRRAGCTLGWVTVTEPRAAVDIDSVADWELARQLLAREADGAAP
jgi:hypothetical protein